MGLASFNKMRRLNEKENAEQEPIALEDLRIDIALEELKVDELKELAKEKGIENYDKMKKSELISALEGD